MMIACVGTFRAYDNFIRQNLHLRELSRHVGTAESTRGVNWTDIYYLHDAEVILRDEPDIKFYLFASLCRREKDPYDHIVYF